MDINIYQREARTTAVFPRDALNVNGVVVNAGQIYCALKLSGEGGEYAEKLGKLIRGDFQTAEQQQAARHSRMMELGDMLWYIANAADVEGYSLSEIANANLTKLKDRAERGVIKGSGDNR